MEILILIVVDRVKKYIISCTVKNKNTFGFNLTSTMLPNSKTKFENNLTYLTI